jgi:hypothetical protein
MSGFADGYYDDPRIRLEIVEIFTNPQHTALAVHMLGKSFGDGSLGQRETENLVRGVAHFPGPIFVNASSWHGLADG